MIFAVVLINPFPPLLPGIRFHSQKILQMKKLLLFLPVAAALAFATSNDPLSEKERNAAVNSLTETKNQLIESVKGLSGAQLKFKPAPDRWSVEDCLKHIAFAEMGLWQMCDGMLKQPANPDKRTEIKITDEDLVKKMQDRTNKVKTSAEMEPQNTPFKSAEEAMASFKENREKLINYMKTTQDDLRGRVTQQPMGPLGVVDSYQVVMMISAHSNRHTQQINEVKADPNFPKQ